MDRIRSKFNSESLKLFFQNKTNAALVGVLVLILIGISFAGYKFFTKKAPDLPEQQVDLAFDPDGPYAVLNPRRDGNALDLNIFRAGSYDEIKYTLAYQSIDNSGEGGGDGSGPAQPIDRGVEGTLNLNIDNKKSEYQQEILFGTCSQGFSTGGAHCVFDTGVENGTLALHIKNPVKKGDKFVTISNMNVTWHLQQPDIALGVITSGDEHFTYKTEASRTDLASVGWTIVNDLTGTPKIPDNKKILGKVYAFNTPSTKVFPQGNVTIELADNPPANAQIALYDDKNSKWNLLESKVTGDKVSANASNNGLFTVLADK